MRCWDGTMTCESESELTMQRQKKNHNFNIGMEPFFSVRSLTCAESR